jgi:putative ABC transport system permease protein
VSSWLPALRIARRSVLRNPWRSLLIALLIALPVAAATYADIIGHTFSSARLTAQQMVGSADGALTVTPAHRLDGYDPRWLDEHVSGLARERDPAGVELARLLPPGSHVAPMPRYQPIELRVGRTVVRTRILLGDVREPLQRFLLRRGDGGPLPRADEVLLTPHLATRLHLLVGNRLRPRASIVLVGGPRVPVVGLARDPSCLSCEQIVARPGSPIARAAAARSPLGGYAYASDNGPTTTYPTYLVDLPDGTSLAALGRSLAAHGVALTTRAALARGAQSAGGGDSLGTGGAVALITVLGLLEVVLLAGAAFAVGARRQVRELGLVAASGGSARDIRRTVLAQGLVLSLLGALLGVASGAVVALAGLPLWERLAGTEIAGWAFSPGEIAAVALAGVLSGVAASALPALWAGRMLPVDALAARFRGGSRSHGRRSLTGAVLLVLGLGCGLYAGHLLTADFAAYERALPSAAITGRDIFAPSPGGPVRLIAGGAVLDVIGLVLLMPALIGWIARAGAHLPLSARLAVRDADRHGHRTGPAASAIAVAVTGSIALAFLLAGSFHARRVNDHPSVPPHTLAVRPTDTSTRTLLVAARLAAVQVPGGRRHTISIPFVAGEKPALGREDEAGRTLSLVRQDSSCPAGLAPGVCSPIAIPPGGPLAIAGVDAVLRLVAGKDLDRAERRALARGSVLVFDATMLDAAGDVHVSTPTGDLRLPGRLVPSTLTYGVLPAGLISAQAARAHGWSIAPGLVLVSYSPRASPDEVAAALTAADQAGASATRNSLPDKPENLVLTLLAAAAAFVTVVGVAVSVALSVAESRADLATLAAVGAQPARRRLVSASQALLVGGLGCTLGAGVGAFVAFTARATTGSSGFVVPWTDLAVTVLAVPLLAACVAALCTRARLPMVRRVD